MAIELQARTHRESTLCRIVGHASDRAVTGFRSRFSAAPVALAASLELAADLPDRFAQIALRNARKEL